jgi:hypothetical protein
MKKAVLFSPQTNETFFLQAQRAWLKRLVGIGG